MAAHAGTDQYQRPCRFARGFDKFLAPLRRIVDLPAEARALVERIAELTGVPVCAGSVGPERSALAT